MLVSLTTDFGLADGYVAAVKGAMLRVAPSVRLIDVSHAVEPQDVMGAAFVLAQALPHFPDRTVHLVVVDPGVGTDRRAVAVEVEYAGLRGPETYTFVGPDNGILSLLLADPHAGGSVRGAVVLDRPEAWGRPSPTATFHGRDVFGPVAARLAAGAALSEVGSAIGALAPLHWPLPIVDAQGIDGMVLHVDRFGNGLTNISAEAVEHLGAGRSVTCYAGSAVVRGLARTYGQVAHGEPVALFGSGGHLEIAVNGGSAAELLGIRRGATVTLLVGEARPARARRESAFSPTPA